MNIDAMSISYTCKHTPVIIDSDEKSKLFFDLWESQLIIPQRMSITLCNCCGKVALFIEGEN